MGPRGTIVGNIIQTFVKTLLALRFIARRGSGRPRRSRPLHFGRLVPALVVLASASCTHAPLPRIAGAPAAPASSAEPWRAPRGAVPPEPARVTAALPSDIAPRRDSLTLGDVVDLALRNNPQTQLSWA